MSSKKDFYQILGVARDASSLEIKRAYKRLAMKCHPDRHTEALGKKEAEHQFKTLQEAYAVLGDEEKRARYDRLGHRAFEQQGQGGQGGGFDGFNPYDLFQQVMQGFQAGGFAGEGHFQSEGSVDLSGEEIRVRLEVPLLSILTTQKRTLSFRAQVRCGDCQGRGSLQKSAMATCSGCRGRGVVQEGGGFFLQTSLCRACHGSGKRIEKPCGRCHGKSLVQDRRQIEIEIPAGIESGAVMRLARLGHDGAFGAASGHLLVHIEVLSHPLFQRKGANLVCEVVVPWTQAFLGGKVEVPTLEGASGRLTLPKATQDQSLLKIKHRGLPHAQGHQRGDLFCRIRLEGPKALNAEQNSWMEQLHATLTTAEALPQHQPETAAYLKRVADNNHTT